MTDCYNDAEMFAQTKKRLIFVAADVRLLKHNCVFKTIISDCNTQTYA